MIMVRIISALLAVFLTLPAFAADEAAPVAATAAASVGYVIGAGDVLGIEVWKDPDLTRTVVVLPDNRITFPLVGDLVAGGRTVADLKKELTDRLVKYVPDAVVTLDVRQSNSMYFFVLGRVNAPGKQVMPAPVTVLQGLAMAGGPNAFADSDDIRVFRRDGAQTVVLPFTYSKVTKGKRLEENVELKRGDVIFVP